MLKMHMTACLLASALVAAPALAQTGTTTQNPPANAPAGSTSAPAGTMTAPGSAGGNTTVSNTNMANSGNFITRREAGMLSASDLIGKEVRGANNEDIGEIGDVLIDRTGQVKGVVVDVGGFLGLGETHVAVPMQALQFRSRNQQTAGAAGTNRTDTTGSTAGTGAANQNMNQNQNMAARTNNQTTGGAGADADEPDLIVLVMTKEQLQNAPKFEDDDQASTSRTGGTTAPAGNTGTGTTTAPRQ